MLNKLECFVLDSAEADEEPLFVLVGATIDAFKGIQTKEVMEAITNLARKKYLTAYYHSLKGDGNYELLASFPGKRGKEWLLRIQYVQAEDYPPSGGEFFFHSSLKGLRELEQEEGEGKP